MYLILSASKDAYITNKIINNKFRATDANTGEAATLDIFKLYGESTSGSNNTPIELSRAFVKFDLSELRALMKSSLDISDSSFKCMLSLKDIYGGQTTPSNFNLLVFPLAKNFDEGIGRDIISFSDLDTTNWVTASVASGVPIPWSITGANSIGLLGSPDIDVISSGNLNDGNGIVPLYRQQFFATGEEDLSVDVTKVVSATLAGLIADHGFRIAYSGTYAGIGSTSEETDAVTRFVKRFASRNTINTTIRPRIIVKYDDTIQDNHESFFFNISGSLFLNNFHRGVASHMLSGAANSEVSGHNCINLILKSGSFSKTIAASQYSVGNNFITGVYSASFAISAFNSLLRREVVTAASATFTEIWGSTDGTVGYHTGSLIIKTVPRTSFGVGTKRYFVNITNLGSRYTSTDKIKLRVFAEDVTRPVKYKKIPIESISGIYSNMHYRVVDFDSGDVVIPFDTTNNSTLLSTDSSGMFFEFYMSSLPRGRTYVFEFMITVEGYTHIFTSNMPKFSVD